MITCNNCGAEHPDDLRFCNKCGASLLTEKKYYCPHCNAEIINMDSLFCTTCGNRLPGDHMHARYEEGGKKYICDRCGYKLSSGSSSFCNNCGKKFDEENKPLTMDDEHPLYRLCTYCGEPYLLKNDIVKCSVCGHDLDLKPRNEPKLTPDEQEVIVQRVEEERRIQEEKEKKEAEERKAAEEEMQRQRQLKKEKIIKSTKKGLVTSAAAIVILTALAFVWSRFDKTNISKADAALAAGDYNAAVKYYSYVMPISKTASEVRKKSASAKDAGLLYEFAKEEYDNGNYINAADCSYDSFEKCPQLTIAEELYKKSVDSIGKYAKDNYDKENYRAAYDCVNKTPLRDMNDTAKNVKNSIEKIINKKYYESLEEYKAYNIDTALKYTDEILDINPEYKPSLDLKTNITDYNTYAEYLNVAAGAYKNNNYDRAKEYLDKVPDNDAGKKAKANYPTFINNLTNDLKYLDAPVAISNKQCQGWYSLIHNNDRADYSFTLENRLNRPVTVSIKFQYNNNVRYSYYSLSAKDIGTYGYTMYNIFVSSGSNNSSINIDSFELE